MLLVAGLLPSCRDVLRAFCMDVDVRSARRDPIDDGREEGGPRNGDGGVRASLVLTDWAAAASFRS